MNSIPFRSVPSFGIGSSAELGMPRNECFLPRNNGNHSESIPRNFFGTKFRSQPYLEDKGHVKIAAFLKTGLMHGGTWSNRTYVALALSSLLATCVVF